MAGKRRKARTRKRRQRDFSSADALLRALNHPVRVKALTILTNRVASPKQIADELDLKLSNVSYHVRVLEELGLAEIVEEEAVRGSVAHFYKAVQPEIVGNSAWTSLNPEVRQALSGYIVDTLLSDLAASVSAGLLGKHDGDDRLLTRTPLRLDEAGWKKVRKIQASALEKVIREQAAAEGRMNGSEASVIQVVLGQFLFEVPSEGGGDA